MNAPRHPTRAEHWGAAEIEAILRARRPAARVVRASIAEHAACGDGVASTADRVAFDLDYAAGAVTDLPERLLLKTLLLHPTARLGLQGVNALGAVVRGLRRLPMAAERSESLVFRMVAFYQKYFPQAPDAMYENEVRFYRDFRDALDIEAPRTFGSVFDEDSGHFGVLMEDLRLRDARFPSALESLPLDVVRTGIENLARLHAHFWCSPRLERDLAWLPTSRSGEMHHVFQTIGLEIIRDQVRSNAFKAERIAPLGADVTELWELLWRAQDWLATRPQTLLHGDTHVGNTYIVDGRAGLLDWQLMMRGTPMHDVTYYITTALSIDERRRHEDDLIAHYREALARSGVDDVPSVEALRDDHRVAAIWGLVIGWLITPPENYGPDITWRNLARVAAAVEDLGPLAAIEEG